MRERWGRGFLPVVLMLLLSLAAGPGMADDTAPAFALKDAQGTVYDLAAMKDKPLTVLYFFEVKSPPTQQGLLALNEVARRHRDELRVWAITASAPKDAASFSAQSGVVFPVLPDDGKASALYGGEQLPVVCLIGPRLKLLQCFKGEGKSAEMLTSLAELELQRKKAALAKALANEAVKKEAGGVRAQTVKAYATLREGKLDQAEEEFRRLATRGAEGEVRAKEGLAAVYTGRRDYDKALPLIREVQQKAPDRAYADVLEAEVHAARQKNKEAEAALRKAVAKKTSEPYLQTAGYNMLGQSYARQGEQKKARDLFEKAEKIDPYNVEGTTNKGLTYEKEGKWDLALQSYREALALDGADRYAQVLEKRAREMMEVANRETERGKRMDRLVQELVQRYRSQQKEKPPEDTWTSRPMVLTFLDFQEKGLSERGGFSTVFLKELTDRLNSSGRVTVVDRKLLDRVLEELNLGTSQLADPDTKLNLGKIFAAKLLGTGSVIYLPDRNLLTFELIDVETSQIPQVSTKDLGAETSMDTALAELDREILKTVLAKYPVRGYVVKVNGDEAMVNVGIRQGVVPGTRFDVLDEAEAIKYKGKTLHMASKVAGEVEVVRVEPEVSYVRVVSGQRPVKADDKIQAKASH